MIMRMYLTAESSNFNKGVALSAYFTGYRLSHLDVVEIVTFVNRVCIFVVNIITNSIAT